MGEEIYKGKISFINFDKHFATIEYLSGTKVKSVNFKTDAPGTGKKPHQFRLGDSVHFQLRLSDRGDKMTAFQVKFSHNTAIDLLIQKSAIENRFSGYLKIVDDHYFVKEWDSYILFPIQLSPWEVPPVESAANEPISFKLVNLDKPNNILAELFSHNYIPAFRKSVELFNSKAVIPAVIHKITPHAVYVSWEGGNMTAKLPGAEKENPVPGVGEAVDIRITHLTPYRIVVERIKN